MGTVLTHRPGTCQVGVPVSPAGAIPGSVPRVRVMLVALG